MRIIYHYHDAYYSEAQNYEWSTSPVKIMSSFPSGYYSNRADIASRINSVINSNNIIFRFLTIICISMTSPRANKDGVFNMCVA